MQSFFCMTIGLMLSILWAIRARMGLITSSIMSAFMVEGEKSPRFETDHVPIGERVCRSIRLISMEHS